MGADGGSIPKRDELVKTKAKAERHDPALFLAVSWFFCALSKEPLQEPIVSCGLGKLYNRVAVLQYLLDKSHYGDAEAICGHITSLKDVTTLHLTPIAADQTSTPTSNTAVKATMALANDANLTPRFVCPISGREMTGKIRFVYLHPCGHVLAEQALREVHSGSTCLVCSTAYDPATDIVPLNPRPDEIDALRANLAARKARVKAGKKDKKRDKKRKSTDTPSSLAVDKDAVDVQQPVVKKQRAVATVNMALPDMPALKPRTAAIESLYAKPEGGDRGSSSATKSAVTTDFMTRGTVRRIG
ncbi:hypothetical protein AMAG_03266 [Allomyces macrogynus ATCC 38327]|uniref:Uncharacterized protein n=1 Tax=Allomyces macrogynus (strain ATCC 38327) TaxID=578462 RepID=A0A0L0S582_ALLM3|nr:hypothetical protein AMAG_03266 [Allomyces macrogynus ATCC 38327]|eukprot:KNE57571.1 hypothetical protein AMAG_03266 [Allomyces macrogynus ATCC 38327]